MQEINIFSFLAVLSLQSVGVFAHWYKMKRNKRAMGTFYDYMISDYPGRSAATVFVLIGAAWLSVTSGAADLINPELVFTMLSKGILHVASVNGMVSAAVAGYTLDSVVNKG